MKYFFAVITAAVLALTFSFNTLATEQNHQHAQPTETYHCPMHPEVTGHKGDTCPKCGMNLVKVDPAIYHCPMHPEVTGHKGDTCPKCGMNLIPASKEMAHEMTHMQHQE